ncbi:bifunctional cobalt-precorrin-7 (C(5))-methyltransferase/cobalt-precorrin-6B (C(15))-methyltransferase [Synechococcus elongatus]|uniref:Precorrin-6Y C5,15-methyltransferase (Decarboxylating) n=2 Tax=Synechococcus elongatus TaxID=32046 RepID=Q31M39_SYNE7|nr:bifunctional cobalt-precorrin-7 (C(5))-methyltransferase/cobalt-precorrin-6B (C(15))-methyltransferase [Synechococcus elongatus]ABB57880.1 precorrin-6Y C5,15-methyltransferase (decarboxylating) [Synechococcus elongatus PCC 7942 = FACHB-805]AJD57638.1 precorrin-6Y C5,15-methyltransferase [Synechococcus elongatus UTEX 2973]MBD2586596.1 bifunctional cobalt-precorrin-7 (C(5))-methyltransferase/cobalt-precorrin-6B (C(15))-methyltransferase [Synechococcus elongatus FACHB-242]MBD2687670.1 bifunctio
MDTPSLTPWLSIVGISEEGWLALTPIAQQCILQADILVGSDRHFDLLPSLPGAEQWRWGSPFSATITQILERRGQSICILASGDPMCYGVGSLLAQRLPLTELQILPAPSAFSLACSRLGWALPEVETLSLCGRDPALLNALLYPGAKILALSADRSTPATIAEQLCQQGWGSSRLTVLEHLGGPKERKISEIAEHWSQPTIASLNTVAIECHARDRDLIVPPRLTGLPDAAYHHDGQLTKREVRAITLAALAPLPGQLLWDVGAGCGSIGIEWMRSDRRCRAIAIEQHPQRLQIITQNAIALGVPNLQVVAGSAPATLSGLPQPDAIFIGGGVTAPGVLDQCWQALPMGGRLVVNAVTLESEQVVLAGQQRWGGDLIRVAVQRAEPIGRFLGWKSLAPITQWTVKKTA